MEQVMHYWPAIAAFAAAFLWLGRLENRMSNNERQRLEDRAAAEKQRGEDRAHFAEKVAEVRSALTEQTREIRLSIEARYADTGRQMAGMEKVLGEKLDIFARLSSIDRQMNEVRDRLPS